jgi:hypothetical protein
MDLDEWELLSDDGFIENHDEDPNNIFSISKNPKNIFKFDHFKCPSSPRIVPFQLDQQQITEKPSSVIELEKKQIKKLPLEINDLQNSSFDEKMKGSNSKIEPLLETDDRDSVSQLLFFNKTKENQFVDMKQLDTSPKSNTMPQTGDFKFDEKSKVDDQIQSTEIKEEDEELNLWKMSLNGIGAIFSFGVAAAATICIIALGGHQKNNKQLRHNQKLHFQFYTDDKQRIKQVVQHAAISAVRSGGGVRLTNSAHISFGGYYNNAL